METLRRMVCAIVTKTRRKTNASSPAVRLNAGAMPLVNICVQKGVQCKGCSASEDAITQLTRSIDHSTNIPGSS